MLEQFRTYLTDKARIKDKYIPYYLKWVSDCYSFLDQPPENPLGDEQRQEFLKHISKRQEEWQVNQADYALRLYSFFLNRELKESSEESQSSEEKWKEILEETRKALRLRHRMIYDQESPPFDKQKAYKSKASTLRSGITGTSEDRHSTPHFIPLPIWERGRVRGNSAFRNRNQIPNFSPTKMTTTSVRVGLFDRVT